MPLAMPGFEHPFLADPGKRDWFAAPTEYGARRWKVENPEVADYLIGVARRLEGAFGVRWIPPRFGASSPGGILETLCGRAERAPPQKEFLLLPELTIIPKKIGEFVEQAGFDGAYDFSAMTVRDVFGQDAHVGKLSFIAREAKQFYPFPRSMMAPIDNYESAFAMIAKEPRRERTKLRSTYALMLDRVPLLYAGNELGIAVTEVGGAFPADRRESPFLKDVKALMRCASESPRCAAGTSPRLSVVKPCTGSCAPLSDDRILVVLNGSDRPKAFAMPIGDHSWRSCRLEDLIGGGVIKPAGSEAAVQVKAFGAAIMRVR